MSGKTTKKAAKPRRRTSAKDDLAREYRFDYRKSKSNRFAKGKHGSVTVVVLDEDVAAEFQDSKRVNAILRASLKKKGKSPRKAG